MDQSPREAKDPRFATSDANDAGGLNAVFTLGPEALLLLWRGYQDPARRTTSGPRSWSPTGRLAEISSALLLAKLGHRSVVDLAAVWRDRRAGLLCRGCGSR